MVQDLKRQVTERLLGALDPLAGVRLSKGNAQELSGGLQLAILACLWDIDFGGLGECVKVLDALLQVRVVDSRLESESVLDGTCVGIEKIQSGTNQN